MPWPRCKAWPKAEARLLHSKGLILECQSHALAPLQKHGQRQKHGFCTPKEEDL